MAASSTSRSNARLRGDRAEYQRALARAGDAGEHRQPALRDLDADVLEVVHARAVHADQAMAVGNVQRGRLRVRPGCDAHRPQDSLYHKLLRDRSNRAKITAMATSPA